jgi:voltage-gated potassium channel Kch
MSNTTSHGFLGLKSFRSFVANSFHIYYLLRGVLGVQLTLVLGGGLAFSWAEGISAWQGIYFALITSSSVGYGEISPRTTTGQCISVALAFIGIIFVGLVVGAATRAVELTAREYRADQKEAKRDG